MQMDAGLDTGAMLLRKSLAIASEDNAGSLHDKLAALGAECVVEALSRLDALTYAAKLTKPEAALDWTRPADELARCVRAYNPAPGAHSVCNGQAIKIWQASLEESRTGSPGEVLVADEHGVVVACGGQALRLLELQSAGGKRISAAAFLAGHTLDRGSFFG